MTASHKCRCGSTIAYFGGVSSLQIQALDFLFVRISYIHSIFGKHQSQFRLCILCSVWRGDVCFVEQINVLISGGFMQVYTNFSSIIVDVVSRKNIFGSNFQ